MSDGLNVDGHWDPMRLEQVLTNLFQNAIDASGVGGEICCEVRQEYRPHDGALSTESKPAPQPTVVIDISDSGPGISVTPPQRVFEPFFTTKTKGTGLGLAITRRAIQAHGGEIDIVEGTKATFRIVLPMAV